MNIIIEEIVLNPILQIEEIVTEVVIEVAEMQMPATKESIGLGNVDNTSDLNKPISTAVSLALSEKLNTSDYNDRFKGVYLTLDALNLAHPTGQGGDSAQVNEVGATDVINYSFDTEENIWVQSGASGSGASNTDALPEGTSNLYHTTARVLATFLNGVSFLVGTQIVSTDTILQAFGKLQKQIIDNDGLAVHKAGDGVDILVNGITVGRGNNSNPSNTVIGTQVGLFFTPSTGNENSAFGRRSLFSNTSGYANSGYGASTLYNNTTGGRNAALGQSAGNLIGNGTAATIINNTTLLGFDTRPLNNNETNQIVIGYQSIGLGSNTTAIGNSATLATGLWGNLRLLSGMATAPTSATATGTIGEIRVTDTHIYVCTATNNWVRTALTTW